jgi:hypothetical protein
LYVDPRYDRSTVGVYLAGLPAGAKLLPGDAEVLTSLVVEELLALLGVQLADSVEPWTLSCGLALESEPR